MTRYLQNYQASLHDIDASFASLPADTAQACAVLHSLMLTKLAELSASLELHRQHQNDKALALVTSAGRRDTMDLIDRESSRVIQGLKAQRRARLDDNQASMYLVKRTVELSSLLAAIMISLRHWRAPHGDSAPNFR